MKNCYFSHLTAKEKKLPYFIHCSAWHYDQEVIQRPEGCPWFQLNICMKGKGILKMNGKEMVIREGDGLIIYPDVAHEYYAVEGKMIVSWIAFDGFQAGSFLKNMGIESSGIYRFHNSQNIHKAIKRTLEIRKEPESKQGYKASEAVYAFLLTMMSELQDGKEDEGNREIELKLQPALEFMKSNISLPLSIEEIAGSVNFTSQHFCLLFKKTYGQRPFEYFNALRLNHSKNLLVGQPDLPLKEVSKLSGYASHSYFCQLFKKQERIPPAEFRKLYRQESSLVSPMEVE